MTSGCVCAPEAEGPGEQRFQCLWWEETLLPKHGVSQTGVSVSLCHVTDHPDLVTLNNKHD